MTELIARAPEAATDLAALAARAGRALARMENLVARVEVGAQPAEVALAALAAMEYIPPLESVQATAEMMTAYGRRKFREGIRAGEARRPSQAARTAPPPGGAQAPLRLVSSG
jgi:hypothetical protein